MIIEMNEEYAVSSMTNDIKLLIATAKNTAVNYVNTTLTLLYWHITKSGREQKIGRIVINGLFRIFGANK
ncbi:hypothetical protein MASR2M64_11750 [Candidatus Cloacimonadota bacterium]